MKGEIAVLAGWHVEPSRGRPVRNRNDALAVALALAQGQPVRVFMAGDAPHDVARDYLALGAGRVDLIAAPHGVVAQPLAHAAQACDLVLTGTRAEGSLGSGLVPYAVAALLRRPLVPDVVGLQADGEHWRVTQALPRGARRHLRVSMPAVLAVHPSAPVNLRHSWRDRQAGCVQPSDVTLEASGVSTGPWQYLPPARQLRRLRAERAQSGHDRMLGAIAAESTKAAGAVLNAGSAQDKARAVFDFLKQHALLDR